MMKKEINKFLKDKKTQVTFRETGSYTPERIIESCLADKDYEYIKSNAFSVSNIEVLSVYCPDLTKTCIAFTYKDKHYSAFFSDEFLATQKAKETLANTKIHALLSKEDNKYFIKIPFELKDDLKNTISSAKFCGDSKRWYVGSRSGKKLSAWVEEHETAIVNGNQQAENSKIIKEERLLNKKAIHINFDFKNEMKAKFKSLEFGKSPTSSKSWYVDSEEYDQATKHHQFLLNTKIIEEQTINDSDDLPTVTEKLHAIVCDFDTEKNKWIRWGVVANYSHENPKINQLIEDIQKQTTYFKSNQIKALSEKSKETLKHFKTGNELFETLLFIVLNAIRVNLEKALIFCDENDNKTILWKKSDDLLLNWIAEEVLKFAKIQNELIIEF